MIGEEAAAGEGGCGEGGEAGVFALPPPAGFIIVGDKKSIFQRVFIQERLSRITEGVIDFAGDAEIVFQRLADDGQCPAATGGIGFLVEIADQGHDWKACIGGVPEGAASVICPEIAGGCQPGGEVACPLPGLVSIPGAAGSDPQFRCGHQGAVIVDYIFFSIIIIFCIVYNQVGVGAGCGIEILPGGIIAIDIPAGDAGQRGNSHTAAFAEGALVFICRYAIGMETDDAAGFRIFFEIAEDGHIEIALRGEVAHNIIGAPERFGAKGIGQAPFFEVHFEHLPGLDQRPGDEGGLLGGHEIRIGKVGEVFAYVSGGIAPAAVKVYALVAAKEQQAAVGCQFGGGVGALFIIIMQDGGYEGAAPVFVTDGKGV